ECGWYPGHENVDIVGVDIYEEAHGSFADAFKFAADVSGSKKAIALSECGAMPDPETMAAAGVSWAWCMPWYGDHTQSATYNGIKYWQRMMTGDLADRVIDRSEVAL
ncbi:MAG: glycoside hydrolase family 26 protein, partial [Alistipes sp.]|nr:glycoside hydrolase family 26 protein [Alistipes sp.]